MRYQIWIEEAGRKLHQQPLTEGRFVLGRSKENEIFIANPSISRQHLRLEVDADHITITDLGSTNGTQLNGHTLSPHRATPWPPYENVHIGNLTLHLEATAEPVREATAIPAYQVPPAQPIASKALIAGQALSIVSSNAVPQLTRITAQPLLIGSHINCQVRLHGLDVADYHCQVSLNNNRVEVINLDPAKLAKISGRDLVVGQAVEWPVGELMQVGSAMLYLNSGPAEAFAATPALKAGQRSAIVTWARRTPLLALALGGLVFACLVTAGVILMGRSDCATFDFGCLFSGAGETESVAGAAVVDGMATPTLAPRSTRSFTTVNETITFEDATPVSEVPEVDCSAPESAIQPGWLELPFPYSGSAEDFRRISQRSRSGGRINSFFDHEYPIYPPRLLSGLEPADKGDTLVLYDGSRSNDAFSQDTDGGDYYSGHSGIDFAPENPREPTTPVFAAADGRLLQAKIDKDDNHMVWLEHDPDGDGRYDFATIYFHLHPDEYFTAILAMEEGTPVTVGQRIGTMGTTGRSSGIHLHFEVREDLNRDGAFSSFEKVDPYGYFPSQEIPDDPWSLAFNWMDTHGAEHETKGITSNYLWKHRLVEEVVDPTGDCQQEVGIVVDIYPVLGYAVINSGFTYIARNTDGDIVRDGLPHKRSITILGDSLKDIDADTISLEFLDPVLGVPITIVEEKTIEPTASGGLVFSTVIRKTGRYVLVAKEVVDRVPPYTSINLSGNSVSGETNTFTGEVNITLSAQEQGEIRSGVAQTQYSVDCGKNWTVYDGPFTVTLEMPHSCGEGGVGQQGVELGPNDFILLAMSEDSVKNIEQPPAQVQFTIQ